MSVFIPGSMAITATRIVSTWVWDTPRADLIVMNQKKLEGLNVPEPQIEAFMRNPSFPLSVQTAFVEDLTHLRSVPGILEVVTLAGSAESEDQARFLSWVCCLTRRRLAISIEKRHSLSKTQES